jgi:hypothetical protein
VDRFEVGTCSGKSGFNVPPLNMVLALTAPLNRGLFVCVVLGGSEVSTGGRCVCLAIIDSSQQKMLAQNGFGQSWMSWPRCLRLRSRQRSMRATCRRPRGGRWYEAQVIRMRKRLAAGPRRKTRKGLLERDRMDDKEWRQESTIDVLLVVR